MIICFNCDAEIKSKMDLLLGKDQYKDYSEVITVAVENLFLLDQEMGTARSLIIGEQQTNLPKGPKPAFSAKLKNGSGVAEGSRKESGPKFQPFLTTVVTQIPDLFSL